MQGGRGGNSGKKNSWACGWWDDVRWEEMRWCGTIHPAEPKAPTKKITSQKLLSGPALFLSRPLPPLANLWMKIRQGPSDLQPKQLPWLIKIVFIIWKKSFDSRFKLKNVS
jgi:hypothetical protein